jgi:hypothetical protein
MTGRTLRRLQELAEGYGKARRFEGERRKRRMWRASCQSAMKQSA